MAETSSTDVCIAGGGIVGLCCAYFLAKSGVDVTIIERDSIGSHASGFAYGSLSPLGEAGLAEDILPELVIAKMGMEIHTRFAKELPLETGVDIQHRFRPAMDLAFNALEETKCKSQVEWRKREKGFHAEWIDGDSARKLVPSLSPKVIGAAYTEGVADVDPYRLVLALTQACEAMGVIIQHGDVNGLNKADGQIARIKTTRGELSCNTLVIALGPWTGNASRWLGLPIPIRPLKGQIVRLNSPLTPVSCSVGWEGNYACTKPDGLLWAGTTEEDAGFDESPTSEGRDEILISLRKMIPRLDEAELVQQTACLRPLSKDGRIILGRIPKRENVLIATGTGRKGILLGPAMGKLVSELVTDGYTETNIEPFRVNRF